MYCRLRDLESPQASSSNGTSRGRPTRITRNTGITPQRQPQATASNSRPQLAAGRRGAGPATGGGKGAAGGVDAKMREIVLAEVLDDRPYVRWDDVAGLAKAKQAGSLGLLSS